MCICLIINYQIIHSNIFQLLIQVKNKKQKQYLTSDFLIVFVNIHRVLSKIDTKYSIFQGYSIIANYFVQYLLHLETLNVDLFIYNILKL